MGVPSPDNSRCPLCDRLETRVFLDVPGVPVHCNVLWLSCDAAIKAPRGEVRLTFCERCSHIFNSAFDPRRMEYSEAYESSLHFSFRFQDYASWLASTLIERYDLRGKKIVEIGCGNGDFLRLICAMGGNQGIGFDPGFNGHGDGGQPEEHVRIIPDFYSDRYAHYEADFICCRHVLEHIAKPTDFLSQVRQAIGSQDTVVYFEVPNVLYTLKDLGIWDIIYEHCSYFSDRSLKRLFESVGFAVEQMYPAFGGQFLCLEAVPVSLVKAQFSPGQDASENLSTLTSSFSAAYRAKVDDWDGRLGGLLKQGKRVALWGAGSKGVTFLNVVPSGEQIECVVDINLRKQGKFVGGTGQEIVSPQRLEEYRPDTILVLNPMYEGEIEKETVYLGSKTQILVVD